MIVDAGRVGRKAVYYSDSPTERHSIPALRRRLESDPDSVTSEEKAVLRTSNRVGLFKFPNCRNLENGSAITGNAFLVRVYGQDAIVTSAHQIFNASTGQAKNNCSAEELERGEFYYNISYLDLSAGPHPGLESPELGKIGFSTKRSYNFESIMNANSSYDSQEDWLVFKLPEKISEKKSLDGTTRGYIRMISDDIDVWQDHKGVLVGHDPTFDQENGGWAMSYQICVFYVLDSIGELNHSCDTSNGSSSSILGMMQNGEIRFVAIHTKGAEGEVPLPNYLWWNSGVLATHMEENNQIRFDR